MRDLKFRAWRDETDSMLHSDGLKDHVVFMAVGSVLELLKDPDVHVMQFTGLHDKNGKEIYEGDIVKMPSDLHIGEEIVAHKGEFVIAFVEWVTGTFRLNKPNHKSKHYYGVINFGENTDANGLEVIGNTYENEDLLK